MLKYYLLLSMVFLLLIFGSGFLLYEKYALGDGFPKTSIYRADKAGQSILYETLNEMVAVFSHEDPLKKISKFEDTFMVYSTYRNHSLMDHKACEAFLVNGGHLLLGFDYTQKNQTSFEEEEDDENVENAESLLEEDEELPRQKLLGLIDSAIILPNTKKTYGDLASLKKKANQVFDSFDENFEIEYIDAKGAPVLLSVEYGHGKLYLLSDNYFLSNEYFLKFKDAEFIEHLFAKTSKKKIVFDQTLIGVYVSPGIMGLVRRYHLESGLFAILVIALFGFWRLSMEPYFNGASSATTTTEIKPKGSSDDILTEMLRKNLSAEGLLEKAISECEGSSNDFTTMPRARVEEFLMIAKKTKRENGSEALEAYNKIVNSFKTGKSK